MQMTGRLALVGLGPGSLDYLTLRAAAVLETSDAVIGYSAYVDLVSAWFPSTTRRWLRGKLGQEHARAAEAVRLARAGLRVALVSTGDATVYGMGGPLWEILAAEGWTAAQPDPPVEVVPGVSAAFSANAVLGAPLADDLALISLSDVVAPWSLIAQRVEAAARADFVLALYNPASIRRQAGIREVQRILLEHRPATTPVALVRNGLRPGQQVQITTLADFLACGLPIDMSTIVIVGNQQTSRVGNLLISHRVPHQAPD
jgi:precorrin-3B C17-methyltransferase